jgi:hypothetical protein
MNIKKNTDYKIKGNSEYFKKKYGTSNPIIRIEDTDKNVFGKWWGMMDGNPGCMLFAFRAGMEGLNPSEQAWYGHIEGLGELVMESELEEVK